MAAGGLVMRIRRITLRDFGSVLFCDTVLTPKLNILDTHYGPELSEAIQLLLCSKVAVPPAWIHPKTHLTAEVIFQDSAYWVSATFREGAVSLTAQDSDGHDQTEAYRASLSHCPEQDAVEHFDGQDRTLPMRLCWYRNCADAPGNLSGGTEGLADTKTFRSHLIRYIKAFQPEPINCGKKYQAAMTPQGKFEVLYPGTVGNISLSETEEKLFLYICFLNIAEFWADIENFRDLHHENKPLIIQNFLEFLDASTDISALLARTAKLQRQVILLTPPLNEKTNWMGKDGFYGLFFKCDGDLRSL